MSSIKPGATLGIVRRAGLVIGIVVAAALIGGTVWLHSLQPLKTIGRVPAQVVRYHAGGVITVSTPIRNSSPLPVKLLGLAAGYADDSLLQTVSAALVRSGRSTPLARASLPAGQSAELVTRLRFANCEWSDPRSTITVFQLPVRWHVTGLTRTSWVALEQPLAVRSPSACPGRPENEHNLTPGPGPYPIVRTVSLKRQRGVDSGFVRLAIKRRSPTAFDVDVKLVGTSKDGYDVDAYVTAEHVTPSRTEGDDSETTNLVLPKGQRTTDHWRTVVTGVRVNCVDLSISRQEGTTTYAFAAARACDRR